MKHGWPPWIRTNVTAIGPTDPVLKKDLLVFTRNPDIYSYLLVLYCRNLIYHNLKKPWVGLQLNYWKQKKARGGRTSFSWKSACGLFWEFVSVLATPPLFRVYRDKNQMAKVSDDFCNSSIVKTREN